MKNLWIRLEEGWWSLHPNVRLAIPITAIVLLLAGCGTWVFQTYIDTDPRDAVVSGKTWERQIEIEMFKTVSENDWEGSEPSDARVYDSRREVHHHDTWECGGYTMDYDGNFKYQSRTCSEPVYRQKLYYQVDRWREQRWIVALGSELAPSWPPLPDTLDPTDVLGHERQGPGTSERYTIFVDCSKCDDGSKVNVSLAEWENTYKVGDKVIALVTHQGAVKDIKEVKE